MDEAREAHVVVALEPKKPYATPVLTVHGTIEKLTQAINIVGSGDALFSVLVSSVPSDRNIKRDFEAVDVREILNKVAALPISSWSYNEQDASIRHIGPMAQDFAASFEVGESDRMINMVDASGVALAAIQALVGLVQEQNARLGAMQDDVNTLKWRLAAFEGARGEAALQGSHSGN